MTESKTQAPIATSNGPHHGAHYGAHHARHSLDSFDLFGEMQQEFGRFWGRAFPQLFVHRNPNEPITWMPTLDAYESNGDFVVRVEIPGVDKEAIKVTVEQGDLIIKGERKNEGEVKEEDYYHTERTYGMFYRRLPLPEDVTAEHVHAEYKDGILEVRVPKPMRDHTPTTQIPVE